MSNDKRRFVRETATADIYNDIKGKGPLKGLVASEVFLLAIAMGYSEGKTSIDSSDSFVKPEDFVDNLVPIVNAIAIAENDYNPNILAEDKKVIYNYAEEYANTGIHLLKKQYDDNEDEILTMWYNEIVDLVEIKDIINRIDEL